MFYQNDFIGHRDDISKNDDDRVIRQLRRKRKEMRVARKCMSFHEEKERKEYYVSPKDSIEKKVAN